MHPASILAEKVLANGTRQKTYKKESNSMTIPEGINTKLQLRLTNEAIFNPDYALEMLKRLTSCKSICLAKLITTAIPKFLREG